MGGWRARDGQVEEQALQWCEADKMQHPVHHQQIQGLAGGSRQVVKPGAAQGLLNRHAPLWVPLQQPASTPGVVQLMLTPNTESNVYIAAKRLDGNQWLQYLNQTSSPAGKRQK
jgi:hypothetical protein